MIVWRGWKCVEFPQRNLTHLRIGYAGNKLSQNLRSSYYLRAQAQAVFSGIKYMSDKDFVPGYPLKKKKVCHFFVLIWDQRLQNKLSDFSMKTAILLACLLLAVCAGNGDVSLLVWIPPLIKQEIRSISTQKNTETWVRSCLPATRKLRISLRKSTDILTLAWLCLNNNLLLFTVPPQLGVSRQKGQRVSINFWQCMIKDTREDLSKSLFTVKPGDKTSFWNRRPFCRSVLTSGGHHSNNCQRGKFIYWVRWKLPAVTFATTLQQETVVVLDPLTPVTCTSPIAKVFVHNQWENLLSGLCTGAIVNQIQEYFALACGLIWNVWTTMPGIGCSAVSVLLFFLFVTTE